MKFRGILAVIAACFLLLAFSAGAQTVVNFTVDGDGNIVAKTVNGVTTQYLSDDTNPTGLPQVIEETVNGVLQCKYAYGKQQRVSEAQLINGAWVTSYYGYDGQGNVRQLTNAAGVVTDTYDYDAFGNLVSHTGTTPNVYLYRGERYDPDLGLYYLRARWYNPLTGRFMSRDPEEGQPKQPKSLHKYAYAHADPINGKDPTGKADIIETGEIDEGAPKKAMAEECAAEWSRAYDICAGLFLLTNPPRGLTGGYTNIQDCARGFVSERCGGNPVD